MVFKVSSSPEASAHLRALTLLSLLNRVFIAVFIIWSTYSLTLFDSSPRLALNSTTPPWISSLLRWDAFHFALVSEKGHTYEHAWAFFPALPFIMHVSASLLSYTGLNYADVAAPLLGGALLAALFDSTRILYRLSFHHLGSPSAAFVATALSLLPSSPATLRFAPYSEPFFTYCSYRGMWACARERWFSASVWFAFASGFRSNGVLLSGYLIWGMLVGPFLSARKDLPNPARTLYCIVLVAIPFVPFVHHNYRGYILFCTPTTLDRPGWCDQGLFPSIYAHVQRAYWNVGFLRYWTVSNIPNFLLALPVLSIVYAFCVFYLCRLSRIYPLLFIRPSSSRGEKLRSTSKPRSRSIPAEPHPPSLFLAPSLLPHVLHALALTLLLTFNAHVQIALRVLPSLPLVYWGAAWLLIERPWWGKAWIAWSIVWGAVSCVLWAAFLPPA